MTEAGPPEPADPTPTHGGVVVVAPGEFEPPRHFYPKVLNAQLHPLVRSFLLLGNDRILQRYCHLSPRADRETVRALLASPPKHLYWAGADLFHVTDDRGRRRLVVVEVNSSPSGQKSMPWLDEADELAGYRRLIEGSFLPLLKRRGAPRGLVAVLYDKNLMEASGYAAALADILDEPVPLVPFEEDDPDPPARVGDEGLLEVRLPDGQWQPVRAALRYVTQRPWNRIPPLTRTLLLNPVLVCLAGGRNKLMAAKAYDMLSGELRDAGLRVDVPETIWDVSRGQVPMWVQRMGGLAVVKVPYQNAGQGVYTITSPEDLEAFMDREHPYERFIVQALIGNLGWTSRGSRGQLYHVGTIPDRKCNIYVSDLRVMVACGPEGWFPVALYSRRARSPLGDTLDGSATSWEMLGTNLSVRRPDGSWDTEHERLLLMGARDFNRLGLGIDDLIEAYIQTVLAVTAIDRMASSLVSSKGRFRRRLFDSLNPDPMLLREIR